MLPAAGCRAFCAARSQPSVVRGPLSTARQPLSTRFPFTPCTHRIWEVQSAPLVPGWPAAKEAATARKSFPSLIHSA